MSAPTSSAPLVVNTRDGACWTRRVVTEGGIALYALADVCKCPELVMATLTELAERGIVGSTDTLPVPVCAEPQVPATGLALPWAHVMPDDDLHGFLHDLVSAAMGRWQSSPEVPDREVLAAVEKACADWRTPGQGYRSDEEPGEAEQLRADRIAELEAATSSAVTATSTGPLTVFRASHESMPMGHYDSRQAAMDHVHAALAFEEGGDVTARVIWRADDPEADEPVWECWLFDSDMADDKPTGYVVTALEVASAYDPDADE